MSSRRRHAYLTAACLLSTAGCLPGLTLTPMQAEATKPSNVAVFFTVDTNSGKPVEDLTVDRFTIFEDRRLVSAAETKQTLIDAKAGTAFYTLLLVDLSGSAIGAGDAGDIGRATAAFVEKVGPSQRVAVYAFDGTPTLTPIVPFQPGGVGAGAAAANGIAAFRAKDPASNLNGAVVTAMQMLRTALASDARPLKAGSLVVVTDGNDRSGRLTLLELRNAVGSNDTPKLNMFAVGVGRHLNSFRVAEIGKTATIDASDPGGLVNGFTAAAGKVVATSTHYYLLSYCSPARGGTHTAYVEARSPDGLIGDATYNFNADSFADGCDPTTPAGFIIPKGVAASPPPPATSTTTPTPSEPAASTTTAPTVVAPVKSTVPVPTYVPPPAAVPVPPPPPPVHHTPHPKPPPAASPPPKPKPATPPADQGSDPFAP